MKNRQTKRTTNKLMTPAITPLLRSSLTSTLRPLAIQPMRIHGLPSGGVSVGWVEVSEPSKRYTEESRCDVHLIRV